MSSRRPTCLLLGAVLLVAMPTAAEERWREIAKEGAIHVEARPMPGTALREVRVRTHSLLEPDAIFRVI